MNFKKNESAQKLRGGYYTPVDLASFISKWVAKKEPKTILEPSCGDGVFFQTLSATELAESTKITAFELSECEAKKAASRAHELHLSADIWSRDFLGWALSEIVEGGARFDAVVGNPPFIRYQYLPKDFQETAEKIFRQLGCKFTKHTNAWVPFVLASVALLRPGGRIGLVVPAEVIHVMHAQSLRSFLGTECKRMVIIDPEQLWFDGTLQGAVILLAEKRCADADSCEGLGIVSVHDREFVLQDPEELFNAPNTVNGKTVEGKWTRALLPSDTLELLGAMEEHPNIHRFDDIAEVDVGIVTGANKFFLVPVETVKRYGLQEYAHPMFGRSEHCPGIVYDQRQHERNAENGKPTHFIWFRDDSVIRNKSVKRYIAIGEQQELHTRFKCRTRSPWYSVPSVYATDIGMLKRSHNAPRLILNEARAFTTDTAYRIRSTAVTADTLVGCFLNPLTALSAELEGRHYGGGVLELVPSEIERLIIPLPLETDIKLASLDQDIRTNPIADVLRENGSRVLSNVGVGQAERQLLLESWAALRNRRQRVSRKAQEGSAS
ncbi:MAG: N-6 DNA methylase [Gammaproteobacteria bacterium]|nr:N-6 DNA methylase [Gammaproteobacteria bacterium]